MIEEQAVAVRIEGDEAYLEIERSKPCGLCGATRGCGVSLWGRMFKQRNATFSVANHLQIAIGDRVVIGLEEGALLTGALTAYVVPLILICVGGVLGSNLSVDRPQADFFAVLGASAGLLAGIFWIGVAGARSPHSGRYRPVMLRRAEAAIVRQCSR